MKRAADRLAPALCAELIAWPERVGRLLASDGREGVGPQMEEAFRAYVSARHWFGASVSQDDLDQAIGWLFAANKNTADWYERALVLSDVKIDPVGTSPRVEQGGLVNWVQLLDYFDEDVVACFAISGSSVQSVAAYSTWFTQLRSSDHELAVMLSKGVADMHVHLGGARQPQGLWRRMLEGEVHFRELPRYTPGEIARDQSGTRRLEVELISAALGAQGAASPRETLKAFAFSEDRAPDFDPALLNRTDAYASLARHRAEERFILHKCWRAARQVRTDSSTELRSISCVIDHYSWARSAVSRASRQPTRNSAYGLAEFARNWFRAVPQQRLTRLRRPKSARLAMNEHAEALGVLTETNGLKRLELRMTPFKTPIEYYRFFSAWEDLEKRICPTRDLDIRFAVHFPRRAVARDPCAFVRRLDRESAALQLFRFKFPHKSGRIARVDIAGEERSASGRWFYPFIRMLRNDDEEAIALADETLAPAWRQLRLRGAAGPAPGVERLRATAHVGEDFPELLCGLQEADGALQGMKLRSGDSLGHGLALAWDGAAFTQRGVSRTWTTRGQSFDSLFWLLGHLSAHHEERGMGEEIRIVADALANEAASLYGDDALRVAPWLDWSRQRCHFNWAPWSLPHQREAPALARLVWRDMSDKAVIERRAEGRPSIDRPSPQLLGRIQDDLRRVVAEQGVVVELNPSSNQRTSGASEFGSGPIVAMLQMASKIALALSTDDPGVFGTCIENEFALAAEILMRADAPRREAMETLEEMRRNGLERIAWPDKVRAQVDL